MRDKTEMQVLTQEQREAILKALQDPKKKREVIEFLKDAGLLRE